jgi:hypothetical protein
MKPLITLIVLALILVASSVMAFQFPSPTEVVNAEITCRAEKSIYPTTMTLDHNSSLKLLSFLESINDHWNWWGFITPPAGDIQITFWLSNKHSVLVQTWLGFEKIGTDEGFRKLSRQERNALQKLLPACENPERSNQPLELTR